MAVSPRFARPSAFVRAAVLAYGALVLVASLYPFSGWHVSASEVLWARMAEWPRYYTWSDVALNVAGYVPLALLLSLALRARLSAVAAGSAAVLVCVALSGGIELLQGFLASRVTSALDLFCNGVGALLGAWLGLAAGGPWLLDGAPTRWRRAYLVPGTRADLVVLLLALWLFTQFNPAPLLFGHGDLRPLSGAAAVPWSAPLAMASDGALAALAVVSVAGLCAWVMRGGSLALRATALLVLLALALKSLAGVVLLHAPNPLGWLAPGAVAGLAVGGLLAWRITRLAPHRAALAAALASAAAAALLNATPANPYFEETAPPGRPGHARSFAATAAAVATLWPFAAVAVVLLGRRRPRRPVESDAASTTSISP
jgi:VanZ family protein